MNILKGKNVENFIWNDGMPSVFPAERFFRDMEDEFK